MVRFPAVSLCRQSNIPETLAVGQLSKHQHRQLVPAGKVLHISVSLVFVRYPEKHVLVDEVEQLREHVFAFVHIAVCFLTAKIISNRRA